MPRSITSPKKNPHRVKQKAAKPKHQKVARPNVFDHSVLDYDPSETQFSNYKKLGLLADANTIGAARSTITGFKPRNLGQPCADPTPEGFVHPLEGEVCEKRYVHRMVPEGEQKVLRALLAKHGEFGFSAMARDMKINTLQHTEAHLRRRIAKMKAEDAAEAAAAAEAVAQGRPVPMARNAIPRKIKKRPNRAFSKKSTHFL